MWISHWILHQFQWSIGQLIGNIGSVVNIDLRWLFLKIAGVIKIIRFHSNRTVATDKEFTTPQDRVLHELGSTILQNLPQLPKSDAICISRVTPFNSYPVLTSWARQLLGPRFFELVSSNTTVVTNETKKTMKPIEIAVDIDLRWLFWRGCWGKLGWKLMNFEISRDFPVSLVSWK